jgi:branched-chain amino acid transport system permease protein
MEWLDNFWATYSTLVLSVGTNVLLALSIYLTLACGLLTVANAAFMGIGAYAATLLTLNAGAPFPCAILGGALLPALIALAIGRPTLRLSKGIWDILQSAPRRGAQPPPASRC